MKPGEITQTIRSRAFNARAAAREEEGPSEMIVDLADALDLVADLLDEHQRFLLDLRNCKADA